MITVKRIKLLLALAAALLVSATGRLAPTAHAAVPAPDGLVCIGSIDGGGNFCVNEPVPSSAAILEMWPCSDPTMGSYPVYFQTLTPAPLKDAVNGNTPPPPGFSPLNGTADQLTCWMFPHRPTDPTRLASWTHAMQNAKQWVPSTGVPDPLGHHKGMQVGDQNDIWAGYLVNTSDNPNAGQNNGNTQFNEVSAFWTQQTPAQANGHDVADWVGLSDQSIPEVIQAGTEYNGMDNPNGPVMYNFWYEVVHFNSRGEMDCCDPVPQKQSEVPLTPGDSVLVDVSFNNGVAHFFMENLTQGKYHPVPVRTPYGSTKQAEVVEEDATNADTASDNSPPNMKEGYPPNAYYNDVYFSDNAVYDTNSFGYTFNDLNYTLLHVDAGYLPDHSTNYVLDATPLDANGNFTVYGPHNCRNASSCPQ